MIVGPKGTGKIMAAEVLANELQLDLYHIDLSSTLSKYIGETEKNCEKYLMHVKMVEPHFTMMKQMYFLVSILKVGMLMSDMPMWRSVICYKESKAIKARQF